MKMEKKYKQLKFGKKVNKKWPKMSGKWAINFSEFCVFFLQVPSFWGGP